MINYRLSLRLRVGRFGVEIRVFDPQISTSKSTFFLFSSVCLEKLLMYRWFSVNFKSLGGRPGSIGTPWFRRYEKRSGILLFTLFGLWQSGPFFYEVGKVLFSLFIFRSWKKPKKRQFRKINGPFGNIFVGKFDSDCHILRKSPCSWKMIGHSIYVVFLELWWTFTSETLQHE